MRLTYSTYEAKAHLSELLRTVASGVPVVITSRGKAVAEVRAVTNEEDPLERRLRELEENGSIIPATRSGPPPFKSAAGTLPSLSESNQTTTGALDRFLKERATDD